MYMSVEFAPISVDARVKIHFHHERKRPCRLSSVFSSSRDANVKFINNADSVSGISWTFFVVARLIGLLVHAIDDDNKSANHAVPYVHLFAKAHFRQSRSN